MKEKNLHLWTIFIPTRCFKNMTMFLKPPRWVSESVVQFGWGLRCTVGSKDVPGQADGRAGLSFLKRPLIAALQVFFLVSRPHSFSFFFLPGYILIFVQIKPPCGVHPVFAEKLTEETVF